MSKSWISREYPLLLLVILAFAFFTRFYRLNIPETYVFDEVYHAVTAKLISRNDPWAFEWWNPPPETGTAVDWLHPPLAKYTQAGAMLLFGENTFGWRVSSAVTGVIVVLLVAQIGWELTQDERVALAAAALASLDGLLLVMSRIAMNDIHVTAAILGVCLLLLMYLKKPTVTHLFLLSLLCGVSIASKWSGLFALLLSFAFVAVALFVDSRKYKTAPLGLLLIPVISICVYFGSYWMPLLQGKDLNHLWELHNQIWYYQTHLTATHTYQSTPIEWFFNLRPVWIFVEYSPQTAAAWYQKLFFSNMTQPTVSNIYAFGNPILFWVGGCFAVATLLELISRIVDSAYSTNLDQSKKLLIHPLSIVSAFYWGMWLPWELSPRIMFFYHYTPAVPFLCLISGIWLVRLWDADSWHTRSIASVTLTLIAVCFIFWFPHWTALPVTQWWADTVYFSFESWK